MSANEDLLAKVRAKMNQNEGSRASDPFKFSPTSLRPKEEKSWFFIVLPGLEKGDTVAGGKRASRGTDGLPYIKVGQHWIASEKKVLECPRVMSKEKCGLCNLGFELLKEIDPSDLAQRSEVREKYLPREQTVVNVYFPPDIEGQPEEVKGKVMWFPVGQRKISNKFFECVKRDKPTGIKKEAHGIFWPFDDAESGKKNLCYVFLAHATRKGGTKYNDYDGSDFVADTFGPIEQWLPQGTTFEDIMSQRHDLWSKFQEPDGAKIQAVLNQMAKSFGASSNESSNDDGGGDAPITEEEKPVVSKPSVVKSSVTVVAKTEAKPEAKPEVVSTSKESASSSDPSNDPDLDAMLKRLAKKSS